MPNLKTTAAGTVKVTATILNGAGPSTNYTQDFDITVIVPVTSITGVPTSATAGTDLTLTGTVNPTNATNKTIVWGVKNAGTTGATITGSVLKTTGQGSVTVTATIANGAGVGVDYTQDFTIIVGFVAVTSITGVPTAAVVGEDLTLTGAVVPSNASNKTIIWSIKDAGTTGATIV